MSHRKYIYRREDKAELRKAWRKKVVQADEMTRQMQLQKKNDGLEISQPNDHHEQEADAIARKVVSGNGNIGSISKAPNISVSDSTDDPQTLQSKEENSITPLMAKSEGGTLHGTDQLQSQLDSTKGQGQSLDDSTKSEMETKMNADLSDVKIHTDSKAHEMSEGINAKAFTHGQDVYFKNGNYDPNSDPGKELLAHELVHTQQQKGGVERMVQKKENKPGEIPVPKGEIKSGIELTVDADGDQYDDLTLNILEVDGRLQIKAYSIDAVEWRGPYSFDLPKEYQGDIGIRVNQMVVIPGLYNTILELYDKGQPGVSVADSMKIVVYSSLQFEKNGAYHLLFNGREAHLKFPISKLTSHAAPYVNALEKGADKKVTMYLGPYRDQYVFLFKEKDKSISHGDVKVDETREHFIHLYIMALDDFGNTVIRPPVLLKVKKELENLQLNQPEVGRINVAIDLDSDNAADLVIHHHIKPIDPQHPIREFHESHVFLTGPAMQDQKNAEVVSFEKRNGALVFDKFISSKTDYYSIASTKVKDLLDNQDIGSLEYEISRTQAVVEEAREAAAMAGYINNETYSAWKAFQLSMLRLTPIMKSTDESKNAILNDMLSEKIIVDEASNKAQQFYSLFKAETKDQFEQVGVSDYTSKGKKKIEKSNPYTGETFKEIQKRNSTKRKKYSDLPIVESIRKRSFDDVQYYFSELGNGYNNWLRDNSLAEKNKDDKAKQDLGNAIDMERKLKEFKGKQHLTRVKAVYFPYDEGRLKKGSSVGSMAIPLPIYYYKEDGKWILWDIINPARAFKTEVDYVEPGAGSVPHPPKELFDQLDHSDHLPDGMIYYETPGGVSGKVEMTTPLTVGDIFAYIGMGAAALGAAVMLPGVGLTVLGTYIMAFSSAASMVSAALTIYDKDKHAQLDATTFTLYAAQFITSFMHLNVAAMARISANGVALPRLAKLAEHYALPMKTGAIVGEGIQLAVLTQQAVTQIEAIVNGPGGPAEKEKAVMMLLSQLTVSGAFFVLSVRGAQQELDNMLTNKTIHIEESSGLPYIKVSDLSDEALDHFSVPKGLPQNLNSNIRNRMIAIVGEKRVKELDSVMVALGDDAQEMIKKYGTLNSYHALHSTNGNVFRAKNLLGKYITEAAENISAKYPRYKSLNQSDRETLSLLDEDALANLSHRTDKEISEVLMLARANEIEKVNHLLKFSAFGNAKQLNKNINWITEFKENIYKNITAELKHNPAEGFKVQTIINEQAILTQIQYTNSRGQTFKGELSRAYDPDTGILTMKSADLEHIPSTMIVGKDMQLSNGSIPTVLYLSLHQLKALGIGKGGLKRVVMKDIINEETLFELAWLKKRYPSKSWSELVVHTSSYKYAETVLKQSGHKVIKAGIRSIPTPHKAGAYINTPAEIAKVQKMYPGLERSDDMIEGFEIVIDLTPIGPK